MTLEFRVLGNPSRDNCLLVRIDSGQAIRRLLFDCGAGCLESLSVSERQQIDQVFFSHFHMDHIAGFDDFFRCNFDRVAKDNMLWGPPGSQEILQHRLRGYWWNLTDSHPAVWRIHEIHPTHCDRGDYYLAEAFASRHANAITPRTGPVFEDAVCTVEAMQLDHKGPCLAYLVREKPKRNVDSRALKQLGLSAGPWLQQLKSAAETGGDASTQFAIDGVSYSLGELRDQLLVESSGRSVAYVTDFVLDDSAHDRLAAWLQGVDTLVCEAQYRHDDLELATRNYHATTKRTGRLAKAANVGELILFHLSDRYLPSEWNEMLSEAQAEFPETRFPEGWRNQFESL